MEVTRENFEAVLSSLPEVFQNAQFIALDTEFTGLRVEGASGINYFDTLDELYVKDRLKAETFMAIQIGFAVFFFDEKTYKYSHLGYNFYVYPSSYSDINFTCQSKCIQFLSEHGFNFNKLFKEGIPYLRDEDVGKLLEKLTEKYEKSSTLDKSVKMEIPNELTSIITNIISRIQDSLNSSNKISFTTEKYNSYIRRLIYRCVQAEFGSKVFLESNKDESMTISVGLSMQEIKEKQKEKLLKEKAEILNEVGFSKVIKLLIECKKLLIGHNLFLDILFVIRQFLTPLPNTYNEFKELVQFLFPNIIDTKYLAASEMKTMFKDTKLYCMLEYFENLKSLPEVLVYKNGVGYTLQSKKPHEASYDAYITGLCFLAMAEHIGKVSNTLNIFKNLPESSILLPHKNRLSTPKLCDITHMNLGGLDNEPDRTGVYHLTFPVEWTHESITDLFKNCGFINVSWINDVSAFIKVKKEYIKEVEKILCSPNNNYKLVTFATFKNMKSTTANLLLSPLTEKKLGITMKYSLESSSLVKPNSKESGTKRKGEEDIGEVIERPRKKRQ